MATVNKRIYHPQALTVNSVAAGGLITVTVLEGYENVMSSPPDGLQGPPIIDREVQFCRGTIVIQDWPDAINLLTGVVGTLVFYERKSGTAEASGYIKHTLTNPVIHQINVALGKGGYITVSASFECKAADETKTIVDMHAMTDSQNAPTYISAARGGWRVVTTAHGAVSVYHVTGFNFSISLPVAKACNDADIAYTCVDAKQSGMTCGGSLNFQDAEITAAKLKVQDLLLAVASSLVLTVVQSSGAANKVITIARAIFTGDSENSDVNADFGGYSVNFDVANDPSTPLTLDGTNKIITIEDAA
jgi:hypothetical protein